MKKILWILCFSLMLPSITFAQPVDPSTDPENFKIDTAAPLGVIQSSGADPDAAGIQECGLSTKVKQAWTFDHVKTAGTNLIFPRTTKEIFWYAQFTLKGGAKNNISRSYRIEWINPQGQVHASENFKSSLWNEMFIKKSLQLDVPAKEELIGRWRVRVWKRQTLIDDRYFEIVA